MILLVLVTAVASALLDNVTTVLLIAPVTLLVCDRLDDQPDSVPDRRGVRLQHRRRVNPGRRSARTSSSPAERACRSTTFSSTWRRS